MTTTMLNTLGESASQRRSLATAWTDLRFWTAPIIRSSTETLQIERDYELYGRVISRLATPGQSIPVEDLIDLEE